MDNNRINKKTQKLVDEAIKGGKPGFKDTWGLVLMNKGDERAVKLDYITAGNDMSKSAEFDFKFSSHPGLGMIVGSHFKKTKWP